MRKIKMWMIASAFLLTVPLWASRADAHHPEVVAVATCSQGQAVITATATAWVIDEPTRRVNNLVTVDTQTAVASSVSGAFLASNGYSFDAQFTVPANGVTYTIRATAVDDWGPVGEYGSAGEFRETTVTVPTNCVTTETVPTTVPPTTVPVTTVTTTIRPSTTVTTIPASTSTVTSVSTTIPTGDISIERPLTGPLANTGFHTFAYLGLGLVTLILGGLIVLGDKKLRKV